MFNWRLMMKVVLLLLLVISSCTPEKDPRLEGSLAHNYSLKWPKMHMSFFSNILRDFLGKNSTKECLHAKYSQRRNHNKDRELPYIEKSSPETSIENKRETRPNKGVFLLTQEAIAIHVAERRRNFMSPSHGERRKHEQTQKRLENQNCTRTPGINSDGVIQVVGSSGVSSGGSEVLPASDVSVSQNVYDQKRNESYRGRNIRSVDSSIILSNNCHSRHLQKCGTNVIQEFNVIGFKTPSSKCKIRESFLDCMVHLRKKGCSPSDDLTVSPQDTDLIRQRIKTLLWSANGCLLF